MINCFYVVLPCLHPCCLNKNLFNPHRTFTPTGRTSFAANSCLRKYDTNKDASLTFVSWTPRCNNIQNSQFFRRCWFFLLGGSVISFCEFQHPLYTPRKTSLEVPSRFEGFGIGSGFSIFGFPLQEKADVWGVPCSSSGGSCPDSPSSNFGRNETIQDPHCHPYAWQRTSDIMKGSVFDATWCYEHNATVDGRTPAFTSWGW